jgi:hypothetical protein
VELSRLPATPDLLGDLDRRLDAARARLRGTIQPRADDQ